MKKIVLLFLTSLTFNSILYSNGYQINAQGAKAISMGGAFSALANAPSAIYYNPSGITQITGTNIIFGSSLALSNSSFEGPSPLDNNYKMKQQLSYPIHLYATHQANNKLFFGAAFNNSYGISTKWNDDWIGKYLVVENEINMYFLSLVSAFQIIPEISVGFGYNIVFGDLLFGKYNNLTPSFDDGYITINGSGIGSGFTAGILFHATKALSVGLSYRSKVSIKLEGDSKVKNYPSNFDGIMLNGDIRTKLTTPENITFGIAIKPLKNFILTADYQYVGWSSFDKLEIRYNDIVDEETGDLYILSLDKKYSNSFVASVGAEYKLNRKLNIRAGFFFDKNPIDDYYVEPSIINANKLGYSLGFGYKLKEKFTLEIGYLFQKNDSRSIKRSSRNYSGLISVFRPMNGTYNSFSHSASISLTYKI